MSHKLIINKLLVRLKSLSSVKLIALRKRDVPRKDLILRIVNLKLIKKLPKLNKISKISPLLYE